MLTPDLAKDNSEIKFAILETRKELGKVLK